MITDFCEWIIQYIEDRFSVVVVGFVLMVIVGLIALIYAMIASSNSPTIELKKTEWQCTGTRSEPITTYIQSGKVLIPVTTYHDVCIEYTKR